VRRLDASVLLQPALAPLLDQFVCVRVINANASTSRGSVDYDLSFSTMFFTALAPSYARYIMFRNLVAPEKRQQRRTGSYRLAPVTAPWRFSRQSGKQGDARRKQAHAMPFQRPLEMPEHAGKYRRELEWEARSCRAECAIVHQIAMLCARLPRWPSAASSRAHVSDALGKRWGCHLAPAQIARGTTVPARLGSGGGGRRAGRRYSHAGTTAGHLQC
jgi:hypothetical protein